MWQSKVIKGQVEQNDDGFTLYPTDARPARVVLTGWARVVRVANKAGDQSIEVWQKGFANITEYLVVEKDRHVPETWCAYFVPTGNLDDVAHVIAKNLNYCESLCVDTLHALPPKIFK